MLELELFVSFTGFSKEVRNQRQFLSLGLHSAPKVKTAVFNLSCVCVRRRSRGWLQAGNYFQPLFF